MLVNVRFFVMDYETEDNGCFDLRECDEYEFLDNPDPITYERHTVRENGVAQICLTKMPRG